MSKLVTLALMGLLTVSAAAASVEDQPLVQQAGLSVTPHQIAALGDRSGRLTQDFSTPGAQHAATPAEKKAKPYRGLPATVHQASLGLADPPPVDQ